MSHCKKVKDKIKKFLREEKRIRKRGQIIFCANGLKESEDIYGVAITAVC